MGINMSILDPEFEDKSDLLIENQILKDRIKELEEENKYILQVVPHLNTIYNIVCGQSPGRRLIPGQLRTADDIIDIYNKLTSNTWTMKLVRWLLK